MSIRNRAGGPIEVNDNWVNYLATVARAERRLAHRLPSTRILADNKETLFAVGPY